MKISNDDKRTLLKLARKTLKLYLKEGKKYDPPENIKSRFSKEMGAFTTLNKDKELRGCIGYIIPIKPLWEAIRDTSIEAAVHDPRFSPVTYNELKNITIEISVLTVPQKVKSVDDIVLGRDGVIVKRGWNQGVFLPQVATETGWDKETFLDYLCYEKAGLSPNAWKDKDTELLTFQAIVFSEEDVQ